MLFFVTTLKWGLSILSGAATLAIMILPAVMRTSEEALKSVPDSFREGSFGLGAGKLRTVFQIVLPSAVPGILSGVILAVGRIVGETADADVYSRNSGRDTIQCDGFRENIISPYVCTLQRGLLTSISLTPQRGSADRSDRH